MHDFTWCSTKRPLNARLYLYSFNQKRPLRRPSKRMTLLLCSTKRPLNAWLLLVVPPTKRPVSIGLTCVPPEDTWTARWRPAQLRSQSRRQRPAAWGGSRWWWGTREARWSRTAAAGSRHPTPEWCGRGTLWPGASCRGRWRCPECSWCEIAWLWCSLWWTRPEHLGCPGNRMQEDRWINWLLTPSQPRRSYQGDSMQESFDYKTETETTNGVTGWLSG